MSRGKCRPEKMPMALIISRRSFYCPNFATAPEFVAAFSESASRVLVATTADRADQVLAHAGELGIPAAIVGETTETGALTLGGESVAISQLVSAWSATLPDLFDHAVGANSVVE